MSERINISAPYVNKELALQYIQEALETGQIAQGPGVLMAEKAIADALNAPYVALYANGTASLRGALVSSVASRFSGEQHVDRFIDGKEVIIPAFSFNASLNTVLDAGATARVVDIREEDFGINPEHAASVIGTNTVAVMPVDLFGQAASIEKGDNEFSNLAIVRDAAQAHGAEINGEPLVSHGDAVSVSFYPTKNIAAPEGGGILTANADIDRIARVYRNQGMSAPYVYDMLGDNLRMTDIHAAVLRANIGQLAFANAQRARNATQLTEELRGIRGLIVPSIQERRSHVWHQFTVRIQPTEFGMDRDTLRSKLDESGIGSGVYYPKTMTDHPTFKDHPRIIAEDTPVANRVAQEVLSLPVHPGVDSHDIERISDTIQAIQKRG